MGSRKLTLYSVAKEIEEWRKTRAKHSKLPSYIFDLIDRIKYDYPVAEIIEELKLNSYQIKKLKAVLKPNDFVELPITAPQPMTTITCEFTKTDGTILKLAVLESQISKLLENFLCCN